MKREEAIETTTAFFKKNPMVVKEEAQLYLMVKASFSPKKAEEFANTLYKQITAPRGYAPGFGPFFGLDGDEPQWGAEISVGAISAKFLCGIGDDGEPYAIADLPSQERAWAKRKMERARI